jgi:Tat protein secretion system quality control protein TatD with DNase activity
MMDTHCNLNDPTLAASQPDILARARAAVVRVFIRTHIIIGIRSQ